MKSIIIILSALILTSNAFYLLDAQVLNQSVPLNNTSAQVNSSKQAFNSLVQLNMVYNHDAFTYLTSVESNYNFIRLRISQGDLSPLDNLRKIIDKGNASYWQQIYKLVVNETQQEMKNLTMNNKNFIPYDNFNISNPKDHLEGLRVLAILKKTHMMFLSDSKQHRNQEEENVVAYNDIKQREEKHHQIHENYAKLGNTVMANKTKAEEINLHNNRESKNLIEWLTHHKLHSQIEQALNKNLYQHFGHQMPNLNDSHYNHSIKQNTSSVLLTSFWDIFTDIAEAVVAVVAPETIPLIVAANVVKGAVETGEDLADGNYAGAVGSMVGTAIGMTGIGDGIGDAVGDAIGDSVGDIAGESIGDLTGEVAGKLVGDAVDKGIDYGVDQASDAIFENDEGEYYEESEQENNEYEYSSEESYSSEEEYSEESEYSEEINYEEEEEQILEQANPNFNLTNSTKYDFNSTMYEYPEIDMEMSQVQIDNIVSTLQLTNNKAHDALHYLVDYSIKHQNENQIE